MAASTSTRFDVHPSVAMMQTWVATLREKTGRSLEEWVRFIRKTGPREEAAARDWLKKEHGLGTNSAWWLAERAFAGETARFDDDQEGYRELAPRYVDQQYSGKKAVLRPLFTALCMLVRGLGRQVKICPCQTIVPVFRHHVIAQVKPSTNTRVDFGLCLAPLMKAGRKLPARLIDTGGFAKKDRITHRIEIRTTDDIDDFVATWLRKAFDLDSKD